MKKYLAAAALAGGLTGLGLVDVAQYGTVLTNGFWAITAEQGFHLGLYLAGACLIGLYFINLGCRQEENR